MKKLCGLQGTGETVRVVSMDKDFHVDCYVCEASVLSVQLCMHVNILVLLVYDAIFYQ